MDENKNEITIVSAIIKDTGWPIDGCRLFFKDPGALAEEWPLHGWKDEDAEAVKLTIWDWLTSTGNGLLGTFEEYEEAWNEKRPVTSEVFTIPAENLDDIKVEEVQQIPQKEHKGGVMLLPLEKNMKKAKANHPEWELVKCPECGQNCYSFPEARRLQLTQGTRLICTECGIDAGIVKSYTAKNMPHPDGNRATRRAKKKAARRRS